MEVTFSPEVIVVRVLSRVMDFGLCQGLRARVIDSAAPKMSASIWEYWRGTACPFRSCRPHPPQTFSHTKLPHGPPKTRERIRHHLKKKGQIQKKH